MLLFPAASINPLSSIPSLHSVLPPPLPAFCLFSGILSNASRTSLLPVSAASNSPTYNYLIQRYSITISNAFSSARLHFTIFSLWFCINTPSPLSLAWMCRHGKKVYQFLTMPFPPGVLCMCATQTQRHLLFSSQQTTIIASCQGQIIQHVQMCRGEGVTEW